jgi:hypothetical protein
LIAALTINWCVDVALAYFRATRRGKIFGCVPGRCPEQLGAIGRTGTYAVYLVSPQSAPYWAGGWIDKSRATPSDLHRLGQSRGSRLVEEERLDTKRFADRAQPLYLIRINLWKA